MRNMVFWVKSKDKKSVEVKDNNDTPPLLLTYFCVLIVHKKGPYKDKPLVDMQAYVSKIEA